MIEINLPDGSSRTVTQGTTGMELAESISKSLAKVSIAMKVDGDLRDLSRPLPDGCTVEIVKRDGEEALEMIRHDCAHVMAEAVQKLFPGTQVTIGPNIENGFFYDFARNEPFSTEDLTAIEKEMRRIVERGEAFTREVWERDEAIQYFKDKGEYYKAEIIEDLPEDEEIRIYRQGEWLDLCRGPHMPTTKHVGTAFKLLKVAGAYWRGDSNNAMLTRIYGTAWRNDKELKEYLTMLEEAEKRDHRKLGAEMDLFHFQQEAQGSVFWHPNGFTIYNQLEGYIRRRLKDGGYQEIKTPQLIDNKLWEKSGHWGKYRENMFVVPDEVPNTEEDGPVVSDKAFEKLMALKPMNCPAHVQVFNQGIKSYRDLPIRLAEFGCCHRNEAHGALHGLMRVRQFTQDDAHIFCREDQITEEAVAFCDLLKAVYSDLGFEDVAVALSLRPDMRVGSDELWDKAEDGLRKALQKTGLEFREDPGEGAFYGPKIDYQIRDAIGRTWQCGTLQLDFNLPERLDASYVGEDGNKHRPVMLHRAILGSLERFIGVMIESYAGKLPLWLAPTQCVVATITSSTDDYAEQVHARLKEAGLRAEIDQRNEKINYKVREHMTSKVPVMFVVGEKEETGRKVAIRRLGSQGQQFEDLDAAVEALIAECQPPF
ncbi:MAG: threonine--tRNA ligase [Alphaproteobacteria bacterium]|nr:threonine--tRNA ligase [Alphaproteobacteria bacterium]MDP7222396.1 threonine--tRNA ligase [Alphaproteobacteria bacterium]